MAVIIVIILFLILIFKIAFNGTHVAQRRGRKGEMKIASMLKSLPKNYYCFNDVYLKQGETSVQIDHIIISVYGIFVIETKNYTGWIYGSDQSKNWVKNMFGYKYYFQNPLKQNFSHVKALQKALGIPIDVFIPVVVFLNRATLKCHTQGSVIYASQLRSFIGSYMTPIMDMTMVESLNGLLTSLNVSDVTIRGEHIENIKKKLDYTKHMIKNNRCPKCGGQLVRRNGQYGIFSGCSNYPRCKFTTRY